MADSQRVFRHLFYISFGRNQAECYGRQGRRTFVQGTVRVQEGGRKRKQFIDIGERSLRRGMTVTDSLDAPVFSQDLSYQECGFISGVTSRQGSADALSFGVTYDRAGRMTSWRTICRSPTDTLLEYYPKRT